MPKLTIAMIGTVISMAVVFAGLVAFIVTSDTKATYAHQRIDRMHDQLVRIEDKIEKRTDQILDRLPK